MSSSDSEDEGNQRNFLSLDKVNSRSFEPQSLIQGQIKNCSSYKDGVASITIADESASIQIQLKGAWAEEAIKKLNQIRKWIVLRGKGGTAEKVKDKSGNTVLRDDRWKVYRVVYSKGMEGNWGKNGKGSHFSFKPEDTNGMRYSTGSTNPHARPSSTSSSKHQRTLSRLNQAEPRRMTLDQEIQELSSPSIASDPSDETGSSRSSRSEDEDSDRPSRKRKKRVRPQTRTEWGMKSTQTKFDYLPLNALENLGNKNSLNFIAIAIVKREIYQSKNDAGTDIWLYDPTQTKSPVQLSFFAEKEKHLPVFENGDILIVQKINHSKDRNQLIAYGRSLTNGRFQIIPAKDALSYTEGTSQEFLAQLDKCEGRNAKVEEEELIYARDVSRWSKRFDVVGNHVDPWQQETGKKSAVEISRGLTKGAGTGRQLVLISQLEFDKFYDIQGEIVKVFNPHEKRRSLEDGDAVQLYITDYTRNDLLMQYQDLSEVRLPGQYVFQISLYGHQALPIVKNWENNNTFVGRLVHCRNVRAKSNLSGLLEGTMYIDEKRKDKGESDLSFKKEHELAVWHKEFSRRRDLYLDASMHAKLNDPLLTLNPQARAEATTFHNPFASPFDILGLEKQTMSQAISNEYAGTYLFTARVIDFKPDKLEEFVIAYCTECQEPLPKGCRTCVDHETASHMYQFALVLEGESTSTSKSPSRILIEVSGQDDECLFPDLSPSRIFNDPSTYLPDLSSRLSPLLGNLLKIKSRQKSGQQSIRYMETDLGEWKDFVVEGWKDGKGKLRWKFDQDRTLFIGDMRSS